MNSTDSLDDVLTEDHVFLDGLFRDLRTAVGLENSGGAKVQQEFEQRLFRHMTWEEETLFPALRVADPRYPEKKIDSLVIDHARIREQLAELATEIAGKDWVQAGDALETVWVLLEGHNRDEEKGVYSDADRLIPAAERGRLIALWKSGATTP